MFKVRKIGTIFVLLVFFYMSKISLNKKNLTKSKKTDSFTMHGGQYLNIQDVKLAPIDGIDIVRLEKIAKILRGLIFATVEAGQSGHPGRDRKSVV